MTGEIEATLRAEVERLQTMLDHLGELAKKDHDQLKAQRDKAREALRKIENINNGPDKASGEWRCLEAAAIARAALKDPAP